MGRSFRLHISFLLTAYVSSVAYDGLTLHIPKDCHYAPTSTESPRGLRPSVFLAFARRQPYYGMRAFAHTASESSETGV